MVAFLRVCHSLRLEAAMGQGPVLFHQTGISLWAEDLHAELSSSVLALRLAASLADTQGWLPFPSLHAPSLWTPPPNLAKSKLTGAATSGSIK